MPARLYAPPLAGRVVLERPNTRGRGAAIFEPLSAAPAIQVVQQAVREIAGMIIGRLSLRKRPRMPSIIDIRINPPTSPKRILKATSPFCDIRLV